jgi:hypothetical protein
MSDSKLLDFKQKRDEKIESKRRNLERVFFQDFLGTYSVVDEFGSNSPVTLVDVSHNGCLIQVDWNPKSKHSFEEGADVTLRVYFTKESFIPVVVNIKHGKEYTDKRGNTYMRYGGEFDKTLPSFGAFESFIDFVYKYAEFSCQDKGENRVYFL